MASVTVINESGNLGTDYPVLTRQNGSGQNIQQVQIDIGSGTSESPVTSANPLPVSVIKASNTVTESSYTVTSSSAEALAANADRVGGFIQNNSDEDVNISFGGTASTATTRIFGGGGTLPLIIDGVNCYKGAINAICASGGKDIVIVEIEE